MNLFSLFAKIGIDDKEFNSGVSKSENTFRKFGETTTRESSKMEREFQKLSQQLGGNVPTATKQAMSEMYKLNQEFRNAKRSFGSYSAEARKAQNAISQFALGLDDTTFKQIYMRSQLGLTDTQLQTQANSIKLNARMTKLMGDQTEILKQRMEGLKKFGVKPEDLLPPSTPGVFKILNETMGVNGGIVNGLSGIYRNLGASMEKSIKGWSAQKIAIKESGGDMVKYGMLLRGLTAAQGNMAMAFPIVGLAAAGFYAKLFSGAIESNDKLKSLSETVKSDLGKAFEPLMNVTSSFLTGIFNLVDAFAKWQIQLNQTHPILGKILGVIEFLAPAMTLLFLPLSAGVGLWKGWGLAINAAWKAIGGVASTIGVSVATFLTLAVVIGGLVLGFNHLMQTNQKFHDTVMGLWNNLSAKATAVFGVIGNAVSNAVSSLSQAFSEGGFSGFITKLGELFSQLGTFIASQIPVVIAYFGQIFTAIFTYWTENSPRFYALGLELLTKILEGINTNFPIIIDGITKTVIAIINTFTENLPKILDIGIQILTKLIDGISRTIPQLLDTILLLLSKLIDTIIKNLPKILDAGVKIIDALVNGIIKMLPQIIDAATKIIIKLFDTIIQNLPKIIDAGVKIILAIVKGLIQATPQILNAIVTILQNMINSIMNNMGQFLSAGGELIASLVSGVVGAIGTAVSAMVDVGVNMVKGLWEGIKSMGSWLTSQFSGFINNAVNSAKSALGIHSPSRVMAKEIGRWMPPGIAKGFASAMPNAISDIQSNLDSMVAKVNPTFKSAGTSENPKTQSSGMVNNFYGIDFRNADLTSRQIQDAQRRMAWDLA